NFNTTIGSFEKRAAVYNDVAYPAIGELSSSYGDGYYFAKKSDGTFSCQNNVDTFKVNDGNGGYYVPIYLYKVENGTVVSMEGEEAVVSGNWKDYWKTEKITVDGKVIWKIIPVVSKYNKANDIAGALEVWDASTATVIGSTYTLSTGPSVEYDMGDYGFTQDGNSSDGLSGFRQHISVANDVGRDMVSQTFYLAKSVGGTVSYVLEDEIDVSTLTVATTDGSLLDVAFVTKNEKNEDVLGFTFNTTSNTSVRMEELKISFKTLNASVEHYIYGGVACRPMATTTSSVTVNNTGDFLYYYNKVDNNSTIYLEAGTYSFDFVHNRGVHVMPVEGAKVIFNGTADTTKPVVTIAAGMAGRLGDFIIDGRDKTKTGITAIDGFMLVDSGRTIRNCDVAVKYTTGGMFQLNNAVLENNNTAVVLGNFSMAEIKNNNFVGNATDLKVETTKTISITQNYFGGTTPKVVSENVTPTVYYAPYYVDQAKTTLTANLAGAEPSTTANYTLPVDLTVNEATKFDSSLFTEMQTAQNAVSVEIPVTEAFESEGNNPPQKKVSTIWGFDNTRNGIASTLPANMDLKVTSVPS
ncbi:MAG: hypothetical protein J6J58_05870, partial [Oscillospiraceae bacterium]|nr:hypothetical protein [Oscillospiraceae bacterium]